MQQRDTTETVRLVLSSGELILRSIRLSGQRLTIGRRPHNDLSLDDLTVSGEHAVIRAQEGTTLIQDLGSRNGTVVNGSSVQEHVLHDGDVIDIGIYRLRVLVDRNPADPDERFAELAALVDAHVEVLNGPNAGTRLALARPITSIGDAGTQVAVVARRHAGYFLTHLEGLSFPLINGESIGLMSHPLAHNDLIELAGTMMRFRNRLNP